MFPAAFSAFFEERPTVVGLSSSEYLFTIKARNIVELLSLLLEELFERNNSSSFFIT